MDNLSFKSKLKTPFKMGRLFSSLLLQLLTVFVVLSSADNTTSLSGQIKLDYSVIQATGKFCTGRDSCENTGRQNRGPEGIENDWKKRNCFCDNECASFGDCCIDAKSYKQTEQMSKYSQFECLNLKQYGDIYMMAKCPSKWNDTEIRTACERPDTVKDPFGSMPVTNSETGYTYSNYYCAICNEDIGDLEIWNPRLECPGLSGFASRFGNMSTSYIAKNLKYDQGREQWGVTIDTGGVPVFHVCSIDPALPDTLTHRVRSCSGKSTIVTCPDSFKDDSIKELCHSYTALIFEPNTAYRNVHCAICNGADLAKLICLNLGPFGRVNWQQTFNTFSFAVLFDLGGDESSSVGFDKSTCHPGELYDPFFKKCRNVICGPENQTYRNGRCMPLPNATSSTKPTKPPTTLKPSTTATTTTISTTSTNVGISNITDVDNSTHTTTTAAPKVTVTTTTTKITEVILTTSDVIVIFDSTTPASRPLQRDNSTDVIIDFSDTKDQSKFNPHSTKFIDCPKIELQVGEFKMMNSSSVYIEKYDQSLDSNEFDLMDNNVLVICATLSGGNDQIGKFGPYMSIVTIVCLGISVLCLVLHMIATFISPDLQNLSGKNLFSLSLALLGSYVCFIAAMFRGRNEEVSKDVGCFVLAVIMYFFFMASFFWMLVIAFDVCRTLRLATTQLRLSTGAQWKKFTVYSIFAWVLPLTFAVITIVVEKLKDEVPFEYRPGFGEDNLCWFSNKKALLVYFAVPFAGVMGFNIFLFLFSAYIVFDATKSSAKMSTSCGPRTNFHLYLRLAVIMGLTWVTGLAAGFINMEPLWYAFVALNTLQGLFIFASFTCTKKVLQSLKERVICGRSASANFSGSGGVNSTGGQLSKPAVTGRINDDASWKWSKGTSSTSAGSTGKRSEIGAEKWDPPSTPDSSVPSRYGSKSQTMYTVSKQQANCASYQNSFDGRYF